MKNIEKSIDIVNALFRCIVVDFYKKNNVAISDELSDKHIEVLDRRVTQKFVNGSFYKYKKQTSCLLDFKYLLNDFYAHCGEIFISIDDLNDCVNSCNIVHPVEDEDLFMLYGSVIRNNIMYFQKHTEEELVQKAMDFAGNNEMESKYNQDVVDQYLKATKDKYQEQKESYMNLKDFVDTNGRFVGKRYQNGDIEKLYRIGISVDDARRLALKLDTMFSKKQIESENIQVSRKIRMESIRDAFKKKEEKSTAFIVLESKLNDYFVDGEPIRVLNPKEIKEIKDIMEKLNYSSKSISRKMEDIYEFNKKSKDEEERVREEFISNILTEEERIIILQAEELKDSEYAKSYNLNVTLSDINTCIDELMEDKTKKDYIDMIKQLIIDLKEKVMMINSIDEYDPKKYENKQE